MGVRVFLLPVRSGGQTVRWTVLHTLLPSVVGPTKVKKGRKLLGRERGKGSERE